LTRLVIPARPPGWSWRGHSQRGARGPVIASSQPPEPVAPSPMLEFAPPQAATAISNTPPSPTRDGANSPRSPCLTRLGGLAHPFERSGRTGLRPRGRSIQPHRALHAAPCASSTETPA
jgi:hypothetical protein